MSTKKKGGSTPALRDCACCGAPEGSILGVKVHVACSRCLCTYYCSKGCQKTHWKTGGHKQHCVKPEDRSVGGDNGQTADEEDDDGGEQCAMCLEGLTKTKVIALPCSHEYHVACVDKLRTFDVKQVCPLCRAQLPPSAETLFADGVSILTLLEWRLHFTGRSFTTLGPADERLFAKALRLWRKASDQGFAEATYQLGHLYQNVFYVLEKKRDLRKALRLITEAANQGVLKAQHFLRGLYLNPSAHKWDGSVKQDHAMCLHWMKKAAEQGEVMDVYLCGGMYRDGADVGLPTDFEKAGEYFEKAANDGHALSMNDLGMLHYNGQGRAVNYPVALALFRKSAALKHPLACINLAVAYREGCGVEADVSATTKWFRKAGELGDADGQYETGKRLKEGCGTEKDLSASVEWFKKAAVQDHAGHPTPSVLEARCDVGLMYFQGEGVTKDDAVAMKWFRMAADQGYARGQGLVAGLYCDESSTIPRDLAQAHRWMELAAAQGDEYATKSVKDLRMLQFAEKLLPKIKTPDDIDNSFVIGARVSLHGLKAKPELNGRGGTIGGFGGGRNRRITVNMDDGSGVFNLKPENLKVQSAAAKNNNSDSVAQQINYVPSKGQKLCFDAQMRYAMVGSETFGTTTGVDARCAEDVQAAMAAMRSTGKQRKDLKEIFKQFQKAAKQGEALALKFMGDMYLAGHGVSMNSLVALQHYERAGNMGRDAFDPDTNHYDDILIQCSVLHRDGHLHHPPNDAKSLAWLLMGVEGGYPEAHTNLASRYRIGKGVPQDYDKAFKHFMFGAENGKPEEPGTAMANLELGHLYKDGLGVEADQVESVRRWRLSACQGAGGMTVGVDGKPSPTGGPAMACIGIAYHDGRGVEQNHEMGRLWLQKSLARGCQFAATLLQQFYPEGGAKTPVAKATKATKEATKPFTFGSGLASPIPAGSRVALRNLKSRSNLNGKEGQVMSYSAESRRFVVKIDEGVSIKVKVENLCVL